MLRIAREGSSLWTCPGDVLRKSQKSNAFSSVPVRTWSSTWFTKDNIQPRPVFGWKLPPGIQFQLERGPASEWAERARGSGWYAAPGGSDVEFAGDSSCDQRLLVFLQTPYLLVDCRRDLLTGRRRLSDLLDRNTLSG